MDAVGEVFVISNGVVHDEKRSWLRRWHILYDDGLSYGQGTPVEHKYSMREPKAYRERNRRRTHETSRAPQQTETCGG